MTEPEAPAPGKRKTGRRHPFLRGKSTREWHPEAVGIVPCYPKTQEAFEAMQQRGRELFARLRAEGKMRTRKGVPDGFARRKGDADAIRAAATKQAEEILKIMVEKEIIDADDAANEALKFAISVVKSAETYQIREQLAAARLVLDFTKSKPATKSEVSVNKAEDFLAALVGK